MPTVQEYLDTYTSNMSNEILTNPILGISQEAINNLEAIKSAITEAEWTYTSRSEVTPVGIRVNINDFLISIICNTSWIPYGICEVQYPNDFNDYDNGIIRYGSVDNLMSDLRDFANSINM